MRFAASKKACLALAVAVLAAVGRVEAQQPLPNPAPQPPPTISGFPATLPGLPPATPRPATGEGSVGSFIDSLGTNDAAFEIVVGQSRILTTKVDIAAAPNPALIAVSDPSVVDFAAISARQVRVSGLRIGTTDLSITTSDGQSHTFLIQVVADLDVLRAQLRQVFPDATLRLAMVRDHVVVEGQARDTYQVNRIMETIRSYIYSVQISQARKVQGEKEPINVPAGAGVEAAPGVPAPPTPDTPAGRQAVAPGAIVTRGGDVSVEGTIAEPRIINLIRVPGPQQVLLKVRIAELNRTAFRQIGADLVGQVPEFGALFGSRIGSGGVNAIGTASTDALLSGTSIANTLGTPTTGFGIFRDANFEALLVALRRNSILKILAEPNLVAMNGHVADFLAGGEFPISVPQQTGGGASVTTVQFKKFGVSLAFVPFIIDGDSVRLTVSPEVSTIDPTLAVTLVVGGSPVPGLQTRRTNTTVELKEGQTLAIAGLMQLTLEGNTGRIPGLGDLPYLGPFFSNTSSTRAEKELVVLVTPYLVEPMDPGQVPPGPGDEVNAPTDLEVYLMNRIEGRTGVDHRATIHYDDPMHIVRRRILEKKYVRGPCGYSE